MGSDLGVAVDLVTPDVVAQLKKGEVRVARVVSLDVPSRWRSEEKARFAPQTNLASTDSGGSRGARLALDRARRGSTLPNARD
jgi:hypothetical protein